jgi:hypothetical protein
MDVRKIKEYRYKQSIKIIINLLWILSCISLSSCENILGEAQLLVANAGEDQETIVGGYATLDPSGSTGQIDWIDWEQDERNPMEVPLFSQSVLPGENIIAKIGFVEEGIYRFILRVASGADTSDPDTVSVTVKPNPQSLFEDPRLECCVRVALEKPTQALTDNMFLSLDTLSFIQGRFSGEITSLKGIELCENLIVLMMGHQRISNLFPIANLTKLKVLNLNQNEVIEDISQLSGLTQLEWLNLHGNLITNITPLEDLTKLKYLELSYNNITDISILSNMKDLEQLWMADASLDDLSPLQDLTNLKLLWLSRCGVSDISCLENLTNIVTLKITWSNVQDISSLSNMKKLEWVALDQNQISDLLPLKDLPNIRYLRLWDNEIEDIEPLVQNEGIDKGDIVGLNGNPLNYKSINVYIPALIERGVYVTW